MTEDPTNAIGGSQTHNGFFIYYWPSLHFENRKHGLKYIIGFTFVFVRPARFVHEEYFYRFFVPVIEHARVIGSIHDAR